MRIMDHAMHDSASAIAHEMEVKNWTGKKTWGIINFILHEEVITQIMRQNLSDFNNNGVDIIEITESN